MRRTGKRARLVAGLVASASCVWLLTGPGPLALDENPHGRVGIPCSTCHTPSGWKVEGTPGSFDHDGTGFPLEGSHRGLACSACHQDRVFSRVGTSCLDCHADTHQGDLGTDCRSCHTPEGWTIRLPAVEQHAATRFPLVGVHATLDCDACHRSATSGDYGDTPVSCDGCHMAAYDATTDPAHASAGFGVRCENCHAVAASSWSGAGFTHPASFPLDGAHASASCSACHAGGYAGTSSDCFACHQTDYASATDPGHAALGYPHDCTQCHGSVSWSGASFDHATTGFALTGRHTTTSCTDCHVTSFPGTPTSCYACHQAAYDATTEPPHAAAGFAFLCETCHTTAGWPGAIFDHATTGFTLTGAHTGASCSACHAGGYAGTSSDCFACHQSDYAGAPDHQASGYPHDCTRCHGTASWSDASFDHATTGFALTGRHTTTSCTDCHVTSFPGTPTSCYACHQAAYNATTEPPHAAAGFAFLCENCHTTAGWPGAIFDHATTGFALTGAHTGASCSACHAGGYAGASSDCFACHQSDYAGAPDHQASGYPHDCTRCHGTASWSGASFDHATTGFALTGRHTTTSCTDCHVTSFPGTPTSCYACHQAAYDATTEPPHAAAGFAFLCENCHTTTGWPGAIFDHATTGFALTGAHTGASCSACHAGGYAGTSSDCFACHQSDYADAPDHQASGYPHDCTRCHGTASWSGASFDHATTGFALTGRHTTTSCTDCHVTSFPGTPTSCYACHQAAYDATTEPPHAAAGFAFLCETCHTTSGWPGAIFDHATTGFALTGAHTGASCSACHAGGYAGTSSDCFACHQSDYAGASSHLADGYPHACTACHGTVSWATSWNHGPLFPIDSGAHREAWSRCADCHVQPADFSVFECILCHEHDRASMDDKHQEVSGYAYQSQACFHCHPRGSH